MVHGVLASSFSCLLFYFISDNASKMAVLY